MQTRKSIPYIVATLCICTGAALSFHAWRTTFTGEIRVAVGTAEAIAVRPVLSSDGYPSGPVRRLLGREVTFATRTNASGWIDENRYYDVAALPFALAVGEGTLVAERQVRGAIIATSADGDQRIEAIPGATVTLAGHEFVVTAVRPWHGLVSASGNSAMAALTVTRDVTAPAQVPVFLPDTAWVRLDAATALHFAWVESPEAARELSTTQLDAGAPVRWGIVDESGGEWLSTFRPGSGLIMNDGANVTLIQRDDGYAGPSGTVSAIEVSVDRKGTTERHWIPVNDASGETLVRYENLSQMETIVHVLSWEPGVARVRVLQHGDTVAESDLANGETLPVSTPSIAIRLDDVLPAATVIRAGESSVYEAVLESGDRTIRIPEHSPVHYDDGSLRFVPEVTPAQVRYSVATYMPGDPGPESWEIGPEDKYIIAGWELSQYPTRLTSRESAVFRVRKPMPRSAWGGGMVSLAAGMTLLIYARRIRR
jgi:hypothetical protein